MGDSWLTFGQLAHRACFSGCRAAAWVIVRYLCINFR